MLMIGWTDVVTSLGTAVLAVGTIGTLIFFGLQLRAQHRAIAEQRAAADRSVDSLTEQTSVVAAAAELSFNLQISVRLQEVLYEIANNEDTYTYVWGSSPAGSPALHRPTLGAWAMLDILSLALAACDHLPAFARYNGVAWRQYTLDVLDQSPNVRAELEAGKAYWPEVYPLLNKWNTVRISNETASPSPEQK